MQRKTPDRTMDTPQAGIYIHVPFCRTRCIYCDFYSTTRTEWRQRYVEALCNELRMRRNYLAGRSIRTVYFGGGTPSQLEEDHFQRIFDAIRQNYGLDACEEITLEANPDDLTESYVRMLRRLPFNRLSMGIQTFDDDMLRRLNRRHTARQAIEAVDRCRQAGLTNLSIDLIYGLPGETDERWLRDLRQAVALDVAHLSAYHLTYEEGTPLHRMLMSHRVDEVDEESSVRFFSTLMEVLAQAGYEHYEISNFCQPGMYSRHNSSYWQGIPYLGCGPSAHSFDGESREWNVASLERYLAAIEAGQRLFETETLDLPTRYNEFVMTALRTRPGIDLQRLEVLFGPRLSAYCLRMAAPYLQSGRLERCGHHLRLTREGIFISDGIISQLMAVE